MKKLVPLFFLVISTNSAFSQPDTIYKDRSLKGQFDKREQFYVLKKDPSVKHGTYIKYFKGTKRYYIYETGRYLYGKKEGLWRFFYDDFPPDQIESQGYYQDDRPNGPWEFFYFIKDDNINSDLNLTHQEKVAKKEYSISFDIKGALKYTGTLSDNKRIGDWSYFDKDNNMILIINHTNDSIEFINPDKMPAKDSIGLYRPFFCGGKEYLNTMTHRTSIHGIDNTGIIIFRLFVNKTLANNKLNIVSNTSSTKAAQGIMYRLNTVLNDWVPQINEGKVEDSEIDIIVTITSEHYSTNIVLRKDPYLVENSSGDFYYYLIDYK